MTKLLKLITLISLLWSTNIYADTKLKNIDSSKKPSQLQQTIKSLKPQVIKPKIASKGQMSGSYFGGNISKRGEAPQRLNPLRASDLIPPGDTRFSFFNRVPDSSTLYLKIAYLRVTSVLVLILLLWLIKAIIEEHKITKLLKLMTLTLLLSTTITSTTASLFLLLVFLALIVVLIVSDIYKKKLPPEEQSN